MVEEPQQLAVVIEPRLAQSAEGIYVPAAGVVPRPQDQAAAWGGDGQKALYRGMGISAVEPAAVAVDGRPRRLDVMPIVVRADQIDAARIVDGRSDRLEVAVKLAMVGI